MRYATWFCSAAVLAALVAPPALAQSDAPEGSVRLGGSWITGTKDSSKLQEFEVIPDGEAFGAFDLNWDLGKNLFFKASADKLFYDDEHAEFVFGRRTGFKVGLVFDRSPWWISNTTRSYFQNAGGDVFVLDPALRTALADPLTTNYAAFAPLATPIDMRTVRRSIGGFAVLPLTEDFTFRADYRDENRTGHMPVMFANGSSPGAASVNELPVAIDYQTRNARFELEYAKDALFLSADAFVSRFDDGNDRILWDVPHTLLDNTTGQSSRGQAATYPNNRSYEVNFTAALTLPYRNRVTAGLGMGEMRQDDYLLPATINPAFDVALPTNRFDGKVDTSFYFIRVAGDPVPLIGYSVGYRDYKVDNRSGLYTFDIVQGDVALQPGEDTERLGYQRKSLRGEVHVNPVNGARLGVEYVDDKIDHQGRAITKNTQTTWKGFLDLQLARWAGLHLSYSDIKFDIDGCEFDGCTLFPDDPATEPIGATHYDVWTRKTKRYFGTLNLTPVENLVVGLTASEDKNEYPDSRFGTTFNKNRMWGADVTYAFGDAVSIYGSYVDEKFDWDQASTYRPFVVDGGVTNSPTNDWYAQTRDTSKTWAVGALAQVIKDVLTLSVDYTKSDGVSNADCLRVLGPTPATEDVQGNCVYPTPAPADRPGIAQNWGETAMKFEWLKVRAYYTFAKSLAAGLEFWNYKFDGKDWAYDNLDVYAGGIDPAAAKYIFLGTRFPDYNANIYRVYLDYRF